MIPCGCRRHLKRRSSDRPRAISTEGYQHRGLSAQRAISTEGYQHRGLSAQRAISTEGRSSQLTKKKAFFCRDDETLELCRKPSDWMWSDGSIREPSV